MTERRPTPQEQDQQAPPGGPQRTDQPEGSDVPGEPVSDPGRGAQRVTRDEGGEAPPPVATEPEQDGASRVLQEENAATSLDQSSQ